MMTRNSFQWSKQEIEGWRKGARMQKDYDTMVLSGGAARGFGLLGAIQYMQDQNKLQGIKKFIGTSIGSIIAYMICIGYSPTELMVILCQKHLLSEKMSSQVDLMNIFHGAGAVPFHILQEFLEKLTIHKIKRYITLQEISTRFQKELICCTYNATLCRLEYISSHTHPNLDCITALRMSSNLPFMFETFVYDDYRYIDGGLADNFPLSQVKKEDIAIGIRVQSTASSKDDKPQEDNNIIKDIMKVLFIPMSRVEELTIEKTKMDNKEIDIISISIPSYMSYRFNMTNTNKFDMFSKGYQALRSYFFPEEKLYPFG